MGLFSSVIGPRQPQTPIKNFCERITNLLINNFRGIFAVLLSIIVGAILCDSKERHQTVIAIWFAMALFVLLQPIAVNAAGLIPLFAFPIFGILSSEKTISCLFNEHIVLFFIGSWLLMTLNCSQMDQRIACSFLCTGGSDGFSATKILLKSTMAAFFLSMLCNRMLAMAVLLNIVLPPLQTLASNTQAEANYKEFIAILCNGIATSAAIGSMCIVHASLTTLQFKAMFAEAAGVGMEFPDIFNYLQYSCYAVPTAVAMYIVNIIYHIVLIKLVVEKDKPMSKYSMTSVKTYWTQARNDLGKINAHQQVASFLLALSLLAFFTRWSSWLNMGWSTFRREVSSPQIPGVKDATTAAIFALTFHLLPKSLAFTKIFTVEKEKDTPQKMESGVLFWKFVDKNTDYSYFFIMGGSIALYKAIEETGLIRDVGGAIGRSVTDLHWNIAIFFVVMFCAFLANIMSACGAQAIVMPLFVSIATTATSTWPERIYLVVLGVGLATGFGFTIPFRDTTCYYNKSKGNVPLLQQIKYAIFSVLICAFILYLTLTFYAPVLWDSNGTGVIGVTAPPDRSVTTTTVATTTEEVTEGGNIEE